MDCSFHVDFSQHFIFNTLNCAISLCRKEPGIASDVLIAFSECLHYSTSNAPQSVSLEDELEFIKNYLFIQSIRFNPRIRTEYDIDENVKLIIPRLSIYNELKCTLEDEINNKKEAFNIRIRVKSVQSIDISVWINDICKWEKVY